MKPLPRAIPFAATAFAALGLSAAPLRAQATEASDFSFGIGYANVGLRNSEIDSQNALRFESAFTLAPIPAVPQLRLGAAFGLAAVLDDSRFVFVSNGGAVIAGSSNIPLLLLEPELRLSWRQYLGDAFYVEPGVGVGGVFAHLDIDDDDNTDGVDTSFSAWEQSVSGRAFVNLGFQVTGGVAGLQLSYMRAAELDFAQNASGEVEEFYVGFFGALQF